jgi:hypothetical protein
MADVESFTAIKEEYAALEKKRAALNEEYSALKNKLDILRKQDDRRRSAMWRIFGACSPFILFQRKLARVGAPSVAHTIRSNFRKRMGVARNSNLTISRICWTASRNAVRGVPFSRR